MTRIGGPRSNIPHGGLIKSSASKPETKAKDSSKARQSQAAAATQAVQDTVATQAAQAAELQKIEAFIEAVQADEEQFSSPPEFANMSQAEQYEYLKRLCIQQAAGDTSAWKQDDGDVNLIGIRNFVEGRLFETNLNIYCDSLLMARIVDDKKSVLTVRANLSAKLDDSAQNLGCGFFADDGNFVALTELATGFYREAFVRVVTADDDLLLQQKGLLALQAGEDEPVDPGAQGSFHNQMLSTKTRPMLIGPRWQVQFLPGSKGHRDDVARPGCQVIHPDDWKIFHAVLQQLPKSQDLGMAGFSYLLLDGRDLPSVDAEFIALQRHQINPRLVFQQSPDLQSQDLEIFVAPSASAASLKSKTADNSGQKLSRASSRQNISLDLLSRFVEGG